MPRGTKLTPDVHKKMVAIVKDGNFFSVACQLCGIAEQTGWNWMKRGQNGETPFLGFFEDIKKAESEAEKRFVKCIDSAAKGRLVKKRKITVFPNGTEKIEESEERVIDWTAAAWFLERKHSVRWSRRTGDILEAIKTLVDFGALPDEFIEVAKNDMDQLREKFKQAFKGIGKNEGSSTDRNQS